MKRTEKILGILIVISLLMKLTFTTGGNVIFSLSMLILAAIYYPFGFAFFNEIRLKKIFDKNSYKGISALRMIGSIGAGIALSILCIGILFKIQYWKGSTVNLSVGIVISVIVLIIAFIQYSKSKSEFYTKIFKRIAILGVIGLLLFFIPSMTIRKFQYRNHPEFIKAYENYIKNPQDIELQRKLDLEHNRIKMRKEHFEMYKMNQEKQIQ